MIGDDMIGSGLVTQGETPTQAMRSWNIECYWKRERLEREARQAERAARPRKKGWFG